MCEKCGAGTHRDDAMNRRCNTCERIVRQCDCTPIKERSTMFQDLDDILASHSVIMKKFGETRDRLIAKHGREDGFARLTVYFAELSQRDLASAIGVGGVLAVLLMKELPAETSAETDETQASTQSLPLDPGYRARVIQLENELDVARAAIKKLEDQLMPDGA